MTYVISDIHGEYKKFVRMLEVIGFTDDDELFILGDIVDRGAEPAQILKYIIARPNIIPLMGNHEAMAISVLRRLNVEITEENSESQIDRQDISDIMSYMSEGGDTTLQDFRKLSPSERESLISFMEDFSLHEVIDVGERTFVLVHAGLGNFGSGKKLSEYTAEELIQTRPDPEKQYFDDSAVYVVCGHTPTKLLSGSWEIFHANNNIFIDCGAAFGGRLACLCLDDMREFYV